MDLIGDPETIYRSWNEVYKKSQAMAIIFLYHFILFITTILTLWKIPRTGISFNVFTLFYKCWFSNILT